MKLECILERQYRGFRKCIVVPSTAWCCDKLGDYPMNALVYDRRDTITISIEVDKPWNKLEGVHFCPFCGDALELRQQASSVSPRQW